MLGDLCDAINDDRLPPLVQAALVHAQFETIHPFADGNGRAGRALNSRGPQAAPGGAGVRAAHSAAKLAEAYLRKVQDLSATWRAKLAGRPAPPRADAAAWAVIDILPGHPMITAPVASAVTGRSKPQIYEALEQLEATGVLVPLSASRRSRCWEAVGLLDLLERLEAGQLPP